MRQVAIEIFTTSKQTYMIALEDESRCRKTIAKILARHPQGKSIFTSPKVGLPVLSPRSRPWDAVCCHR